MVLIAVLVGGMFVAVWVKKWMSNTGEDVPAGGFTLGDLRRLRQSGKMSEEEYNKARILIVGVSKAGPDAHPKGAGSPRSAGVPGSVDLQGPGRRRDA
jgi:hypothetical protein